MRFIGIAAAAVILIATAAGCGGGSHGVKGASKTIASAQMQIRQAWTMFFAGSTPPTEKAKLLQNGQRFTQLIAAEARSPLATQTKATVTSVKLEGPSRARVVYSILLAGKPVLSHQVGIAIRSNGVWQVGDQSFCALLALQGKPPAACAKL